MKRFSLMMVLALLCSLPAFSQFWINIEWGAPHCRHCEWMENALRLDPYEAAEYHRIIHKYGQRIEKEARREYRHWDKSARRIYELRLERDRKLQRIFTPGQFSLYVRLMRKYPQRIHDYKGWYANPKHPHLHPSHDCRRYEHDYWSYRWPEMRPDHFFHDHDHMAKPQPPHHPGMKPQPPHNQRPHKKQQAQRPGFNNGNHNGYQPYKNQQVRPNQSNKDWKPRQNGKGNLKSEQKKEQSKSRSDRPKVNRNERD